MTKDTRDMDRDERAAEAGDGSLLDSVLMQDGDEADEADCGLELDASQAQEMRRIFFVTLPQYLEPIEEMVQQLFSADEIASDLCSALLTTVSSIAAAAGRIGIESARLRFERMQDEISQLVDHAGAPPSAARDAIVAELKALRELTDDPGVPAPTAARAQTIFAAFKQVQGIDRAVLEKLTAAGLVTVDQVKMAEPREIAAVTGLSMEVVAQLIAALAATASEAHLASQPPKTTSREESLESELRTKLRARVDAEAALEDARAGVAHWRSRKTLRERELSAAVAARDALRTELEAARARVSSKLATLAKARIRRAAAEREKNAAQDTLQRTSGYIAEIHHEKRSARAAYERRAEELAHLSARVERLLEVAARDNREVASTRILSRAPKPPRP